MDTHCWGCILYNPKSLRCGDSTVGGSGYCERRDGNKPIAGHLEDWYLIPEGVVNPCLGYPGNNVIVGIVSGSDAFEDGTKIVTSDVLVIDGGFGYTKNSRYELGKRLFGGDTRC